MKPKKPIIHISQFKPDSNSHGGSQRSAQICEVMDDLEIPFFYNTNLPYDKKIFTKLKFIDLIKLKDLNVHGFARAWREFIWIRELCEKYATRQVSIEVGPGARLLVVRLLQSYGFQTILWPHNVESIVKGQSFQPFRSPGAQFNVEHRNICTANAIAAISKFDAQIFEAMGSTNAVQFPYYPIRRKAAECVEIRNRRAMSTKTRWLLLGSVNNPPTRSTIERTIQICATTLSEIEFSLAGHGTQIFANGLPPNVTLLGELSSEQLSHEMSTCKGAFLHQVSTSGVLTKLIEFSIAGIPTIGIGNYLQFQEFGNLVNHVNSNEEIINAMNKSNYKICSIPDRPNIPQFIQNLLS